MKASRRFTTTQLVLSVAALAMGIIFVAKRIEEHDDHQSQAA
jgi:hypothetical protein